MRDVDEVLRALKGPPAPKAPPRLDERRPWVAPLVLLAAAVSVVLLALLATREVPRLRGARGEPILDLRITVERGGIAVRTSPEVPLRVGERLFFRLASSEPATAHVWVEGPLGREVIARMPVDGASRDVGTARGLTAYRIEVPGRYAFRASTSGPGVCHGCPTVVLEAR